MLKTNPKQPYLRPQDVVIALKISLPKTESHKFKDLSDQLLISMSEVHASFKRCEMAGLISRETGHIQANKPSLYEFLVHGVKYAFPALLGAPVRGTLTGIGASSLRSSFQPLAELELVWPNPHGQHRGTSIVPLYPNVPQAAKLDPDFHEVLALIDILRIGAARERSLAAEVLRKYV